MSAPEPLLTDAEIHESLLGEATLHRLTVFEYALVLDGLSVTAMHHPDALLAVELAGEIARRLAGPRQFAGRQLAERMRAIAGGAR